MRRCVLALLVVAALVATGACEQHQPFASERQVVRITAFPRGRNTGSYRALVAAYRSTLPHVEFEVLPYGDTVDALAALQSGQADLSLALADITYSAYVGKLERQSERFDRLRGLAALWLAQVHLVVRAGSGVQRLEDLQTRGLTIGIQKTNPLAARLVLSASGVDRSSVRIFLLDFENVDKAIQDMEKGELDAIFLNGSPPEATITAATQRGARLIPISGRSAEQLRRDYPFFQLSTVRGGVYPSHPHPTHTIGIRTLLVSRSGISESMGYSLVKEFIEYLSRGGWGQQTAAATWDLAMGPLTPIPLHEGAALYYRERELSR